MPKFLLAFLFVAGVAFGDDADSRVRVANAKTVAEAKSQAALPDQPPNIRLNIRSAVSDVATHQKPQDVSVDPMSVSCRVRLIRRVGNENSIYDGSGTVVERGILTVGHLWNRGDHSPEVYAYRNGEVIRSKIVAINHDLDLCLIEGRFSDGRFAEIGETPSIGSSVVTCGLDREGVLAKTVHRVNGMSRHDLAAHIIYYPPPFDGQSGGGMFQGGKLCGVASGFDTDKPDAGYAVAVPDIVSFLNGKRSNATVANPRVPRILFFHANWCLPCKQQLEGNNAFPDYFRKSGFVVDSTDRAHIQLVDVDTHQDLVKEYGVSQIPAVVLIDRVDGKVIHSPPIASEGTKTILEVLKGIK